MGRQDLLSASQARARVMKPSLKLRSVFTSGVNLGGSIHRPKKGKGSYSRKTRYSKWK